MCYNGAVTTKSQIESRIRGAVWGHLVGDALGVPYEFGPLRPVQSVRWGHQGTHRQPTGTWSDDGGMMLAVLDSLVEGGFDPDDQAQRSLAWMVGPDYKPGPRFDIGGTTAASLWRFRAGTPAELAGGSRESDNGNGSLMRVLPIALYGLNEGTDELVRQAKIASRLTHRTVRAQVTCAVYTLLVQGLIKSDIALSRTASLNRAFYLTGKALETAAERRELATLREFLQNRPLRGGGYVLDSFWSAWSAFMATDNYADCVRCAVSFGSDTDTTAAIAGSLAGAYRGLGDIPRSWRQSMRGQEIVQPLLDRLVSHVLNLAPFLGGTQ
jgi:ADP-ribosyl-[dinitrogen reductase] hydrolase